LRFVANGDLWVDSRGGLFLNRSAQRWGEDSELEALAPVVLSVLAATTGDLWVGDASALVVRRSDGTVERLSSILGTPLAPVTGLAEDREGGIGVSSGGGFDGAFRWSLAPLWARAGTRNDPRSSDRADREGRLWFLGIGPRFGIDERGAFVFDGDTFVRWSTAEGLLNDRVYDFTEGPDGTRWFATGGGLSRWREDVWTHWTLEDGVRGRPFTLAFGVEGRLWFGHGDVTRGLGFVDAADRVSYVPPTDVLASRHVWDLALGPDSALWVSTQSGLGVIRKGEHAFLGAKEGLNDLALWPLVPMQDRVLVGTSGGGLVELVTSEASSPPPVVSARAPLIDRGAVLLRWYAMAYNGQQSPEDIPTRYRIDDKDWSSWSTTREFGP
jgi:ligand-binding sensor domain-containing protein